MHDRSQYKGDFLPGYKRSVAQDPVLDLLLVTHYTNTHIIPYITTF